mgnify:FL=1
MRCEVNDGKKNQNPHLFKIVLNSSLGSKSTPGALATGAVSPTGTLMTVVKLVSPGELQT